MGVPFIVMGVPGTREVPATVMGALVGLGVIVVPATMMGVVAETAGVTVVPGTMTGEPLEVIVVPGTVTGELLGTMVVPGTTMTGALLAIIDVANPDVVVGGADWEGGADGEEAHG